MRRNDSDEMPNTPQADHDFLHSGDKVSLKEFILGIINEREHKWQHRFERIDRQFEDSNQLVKDALTTANSKLSDALSFVDRKFTETNDVHKSFATKDVVNVLFSESEKAVLKAEAAAEKRFEAVNGFRLQLAEQQAGFATKGEAELRFHALDQKVDTAVTMLNGKLDTALSQLQHSMGKEAGGSNVWSVTAALVGFVIGIGGVVAVIVAAIMARGH